MVRWRQRFIFMGKTTAPRREIPVGRAAKQLQTRIQEKRILQEHRAPHSETQESSELMLVQAHLLSITAFQAVSSTAHSKPARKSDLGVPSSRPCPRLSLSPSPLRLAAHPVWANRETGGCAHRWPYSCCALNTTFLYCRKVFAKEGGGYHGIWDGTPPTWSIGTTVVYRWLTRTASPK